MDWRDFWMRMALHLGPALLVIAAFISILVGVIFHAISIDELEYRTPEANQFDTGVIINDSPDNLVWFLQVTDLHLSNRGHFDREKDFAEFAEKYVNIIKPDVVLVTGDITDGRKPNSSLGTGQQLDEWQAYSNAITKANATWSHKPVWLDIRGNHDNFNVYRPKDPETLYRRYSIQGKNHERNYNHTLTKKSKNYTFIGVDEVQTPGLKIPFNFIGIVGDEDLDQLKSFKDAAKKLNSQYTIWFAHYPTSSIASPHEGLRNIVDGPYLCGHFHTIGNLVTKMHSTQQPGFVEVELGDWKYNRLVRLAAIDHQLFSFVDTHFKEFPIALMTNPKPTEHMMPKYEPVGRVRNSTHIRVIAFSNATVERVEIRIDDKEWKLMSKVQDPLYVLKWNPADYTEGLHQADIKVTDSAKATRTYTQSFSIDNSSNDFTLGAKILIRVYFKTYVMTIFFFIVIVCTLPMIVLKIVAYDRKESGIRRHYRGTFLFNLHLLSNIDKLFWPLLVIPLWAAVGPHFIGYLVDETIGACFVWGVLIDGRFVHTGITFNVGSIFLLFVHIPEVILLTYQVRGRYKSVTASGARRPLRRLRLILHLMITALQLFMGYLLQSAYGTLSFLTSFLFLWCAMIYSFCWYQSTNLEKIDFIKFTKTRNQEEQQALTDQRAHDDKSSASEHSTC